MSTIFIHHALEDHDEIFKRVWNLKLSCLFKEVLAAHHYIPFDLLETILINAADEILSLESIKNICFEVCIQIRDQRVGTVNDQSHKCFVKSTLVQMRDYLVEMSFKDLGNRFGIRIWQKILTQIEIDAQENFKSKQLNLENLVSQKMLPETQKFIESVVCPLLDSLITIATQGSPALSTSVLGIYPIPIDVNSEEWRKQVADTIYQTVSLHKENILQELLPEINNICKQTHDDMLTLSKRVEEMRNRIVLCDQQTCKSLEHLTILQISAFPISYDMAYCLVYLFNFVGL